jgi:hypothetical protein
MIELALALVVILLVYAFVRLVLIPYNADGMTWEGRNDY